MATKTKTKKPAKKMTAKSPTKTATKKKSQIKAKSAMKSVSPPKPLEQKPANKVHPFAQFMKGRISRHYSSAPMHTFSNHDTYRKKAV
jgi:hypothetical protein